MWLVVQCARLSLCLLHLCGKSTLYQLCCAVYFVFAHLCHRHSDHSRPPWAAAGQCWSRGRWPWGNSQPRHPLHRSPGHWRAPPTRDRQFSLLSLLWSYWLFTCLRWLFSWVSMETSLFRATISASRGSCNTQMSRGCHVSRRDGVWQWQCATNDTL